MTRRTSATIAWGYPGDSRQIAVTAYDPGVPGLVVTEIHEAEMIGWNVGDGPFDPRYQAVGIDKWTITHRGSGFRVGRGCDQWDTPELACAAAERLRDVADWTLSREELRAAATPALVSAIVDALAA